MFEWKGSKMKKVKSVTAGLLIIFLLSLPVVAGAEWRHGEGAFLGFGAGLITGYLLAPRPTYVASPVYVAPPPVVQTYPIPYGHLRANWERWERERYWHGDREWREGQEWRRRHY
jgi:hypothetical protein